MHAHKPHVLASLALSRFSAVGDGMHVEVTASGPNTVGSFLSFREDEVLGMQVLLHLPDGDLAFPLAELKRAIAFAEVEVHREPFYD
jgi:hypothetical protein